MVGNRVFITSAHTGIPVRMPLKEASMFGISLKKYRYTRKNTNPFITGLVPVLVVQIYALPLETLVGNKEIIRNRETV